MKIGILTLPLHTNYGGILQAYALQKILTDMGHEVWIINKEKALKLPISKMPVVYAKRLIKKVVLLQKDVVIFREKKLQKEYPIISVNTKKFIDSYIQPQIIIENENDIPHNSFDAVIVGSDQIWRPIYNKPKVENAFLAFTENWHRVKRIAYAPSFGTNEWEYSKKLTKLCKQHIQKFDAVSVREDSGIKLCKEKFGVEAQHLLDPTMLLDLKEYVLLANSCRKEVEGDLFVHILDLTNDKQKVIDKISKELNYKPFHTSTDNENMPLENRITTPVGEWLNSIYKAKFILTDSFHASIFSILFNKPFIAYGNVNRGLARFRSLLNMFKLEDRFISKFEALTEQMILEEIDWGNVNQILSNMKHKSLLFLKTNLESKP